MIRELVDVHFPAADKIVLVMDNLNTLKPASLYEAFPPAEARRLSEKLEIQYTPKHGSWLDMADTELSILTKQCLDRRIPDADTLVREVTASQVERNAAEATIYWQFTTAQPPTPTYVLVAYRETMRLHIPILSTSLAGNIQTTGTKWTRESIREFLSLVQEVVPPCHRPRRSGRGSRMP